MKTESNPQENQLLILSEKFDACSLNGKPARLDLAPEGKTLSERLPKVIALDGSEACAFNMSTITHVMLKHKGQFRSREARRFACV